MNINTIIYLLLMWSGLGIVPYLAVAYPIYKDDKPNMYQKVYLATLICQVALLLIIYEALGDKNVK